jgi:antibiotic biosynthesis monooxygenase (ABM) superfamily enzyme
MAQMVDEHSDNPSSLRRWLAPVAMTLGAWLVAFAVVTGFLSLFGRQLGDLPPGLRALVMSGVLVGVMVNLVMPLMSTFIARWLGGPRQTPRGT